MNIVLNPAATAHKRGKGRLQARFEKLQRSLQKQEHLNRKFQTDLDALVTLYHAELLKLDTDQLEPLTALANRLITFFSRKSLSRWHRDEISEWLMDIVGRIRVVDSGAADDLQQRFREVVAAHMDMSVTELDESLQAFEESFEAGAETDPDRGTPFDDEDDPQEDLFGYEDVFEDAAAGEACFGRYEEAFGSDDGEDSEERSRRLMDGSWVRGMFRRTAQALHPDREPDPGQRATKQRLMQELLEARKQGDIMNLLRLYGECVSADDLVLAEQDMTTACELMEDRLDELRLQQASFIYEHPVRMMVHELLYSPSAKAREKKIRDWKRQLKADARQTSHLLEELRNLTVLKEVLGDRRDSHMIDRLEMMFDEVWR